MIVWVFSRWLKFYRVSAAWSQWEDSNKQDVVEQVREQPVIWQWQSVVDGLGCIVWPCPWYRMGLSHLQNARQAGLLVTWIGFVRLKACDVMIIRRQLSLSISLSLSLSLYLSLSRYPPLPFINNASDSLAFPAWRRIKSFAGEKKSRKVL